MASTIDTSDGKIILNGGAVALPTSSVTVSSPTIGSIRFDATYNRIELSPLRRYGLRWAAPATSVPGWSSLNPPCLTQANSGQLIVCSGSDPITLTLPSVAVSPLTGFTIVASNATQIILLPQSNNYLTSVLGQALSLPVGSHITITNDGVLSWYSICLYNAMGMVTPYLFESVATNVTASGINQASAFVLSSKYNVVSTVTSGSGVVLPNLFSNWGPGAEIVVWNNGANTLNVYPPTGSSINGLGTNAAYNLETGQGISFVLLSSSSWQTETLSAGAITGALGYTPAAANARTAEYLFWAINNGTVAGRLTTDGNAASSSNTGAIDTNTAAYFDIELLAYDATINAAVTYSVADVLMTCGDTISTTALAGTPTFTVGTATSGAPTISTAPTVVADTTYGGLNINFTPPSANTDTWHITVRVKMTLVI